MNVWLYILVPGLPCMSLCRPLAVTSCNPDHVLGSWVRVMAMVCHMLHLELIYHVSGIKGRVWITGVHRRRSNHTVLKITPRTVRTGR